MILVDKIAARAFLNDVREGIFGDVLLKERDIELFMSVATDTDILRILSMKDSFTSTLDNPPAWKLMSIKRTVENI